MTTLLRALAAVLVLTTGAIAQDDVVDVPDAQVDAFEGELDPDIQIPAENMSLMDELAEAFAPQDEPVQVGPDDFDDMSFGVPIYEPDPETEAAYNEATRRLYEYRTAQLDHRLTVFRWQHISSQIIFFVVIGVVAMGLYFSWMQFHAPREDGQAEAITTIEASKTGVKLSSPVLGVIILVLSLAFFYLYLVHVYRITEIG
ncbi:hypothetical protein MWU52_04625 [Jannaschia sp. S6380]|uniref:hypothetical protein n=1 Tax=Jannaschia sp. S6380 TaxID=2926408 RepID=UPI001FF2A660|nr:hypothetical protein [Jannaschia sp. S6380]MCK0166829.1 hypothetical protein [Jannaschia sp. S6380]